MSQRVGVWRSVGRLGDLTARELLWPEFAFALLLGIGGAIATVNSTHLDGRLSIVSEILPLAGALLAVYSRGWRWSCPSLLKTTCAKWPGFAPGLSVSGPVSYRRGNASTAGVTHVRASAEAKHVPAVAEHGAFYVIGFMLVFGLLDVMALARSLSGTVSIAGLKQSARRKATRHMTPSGVWGNAVVGNPRKTAWLLGLEGTYAIVYRDSSNALHTRPMLLGEYLLAGGRGGQRMIDYAPTLMVVCSQMVARLCHTVGGILGFENDSQRAGEYSASLARLG